MTGRRIAGILTGFLADLLLSDPERGHPVAGFGVVAQALERFTYRDSKAAGVLHTGVLVGAVASLGAALQRVARGPWVSAAAAAATWVALGGTSLLRTAETMAELLAAEDIPKARRLLPALCGRDPNCLDEAAAQHPLGNRH